MGHVHGYPSIRQVRAGRHGQSFTLYKFRTMSVEHDITSKRLLPDSRRIPQIERFMRIISIEPPELSSIVKGKMSLVGARPLLPQYLERYTPEQHDGTKWVRGSQVGHR